MNYYDWKTKEDRMNKFPIPIVIWSILLGILLASYLFAEVYGADRLIEHISNWI